MLKEKISNDHIHRILQEYLRENNKFYEIASCRGGFFNTTLRVKLKDHREIIIQISPSEDKDVFWHERSMLQREVYFLKFLQAHSFPVAKVLYHDFYKKIIGREYIILESLKGHNWYYFSKKLSILQNQSLYRELGEYARKIHAIGGETSFGFPKPYKKFKKWGEFFLEYTKNLDLHNEKYGLVDIDGLTPYGIGRQLIGSLDQIDTAKLIHGDLWPRNILLSKKGNDFYISGILDWERGCWGDPRFEWVLQCMNYGKSFWNAYGVSSKPSKDFLIRDKLYKACFIYQAALEEIYHFNKKEKAHNMIRQMQDVIRPIMKI